MKFRRDATIDSVFYVVYTHSIARIFIASVNHFVYLPVHGVVIPLFYIFICNSSHFVWFLFRPRTIFKQIKLNCIEHSFLIFSLSLCILRYCAFFCSLSFFIYSFIHLQMRYDFNTIQFQNIQQLGIFFFIIATLI